MADLELSSPMVSVSFSMTDGVNTLRDAIVIRKDQYEAMSSNDIEAEAQRRFDEWIFTINNPPINEELDSSVIINQILVTSEDVNNG